jgi:hypothetical protein
LLEGWLRSCLKDVMDEGPSPTDCSHAFLKKNC